MKISCLVPTYGRFSLLRETVAFFLMQDHPGKELVILNDGPESIYLAKSLPESVRIYNFDKQPDLGTIWQHLKNSATGDAISVWVDDDWYLPWHLSTANGYLEAGAGGFKPAPCWFCNLGKKQFTLVENVFESACTIRKEYFLPTVSYGKELLYTMENLHVRGKMTTTNLGILAPYVFLWNNGTWHVSGSIDNGQSDIQRMGAFQDNTKDFPNGRLLTPDFDSAIKRFQLLIDETYNYPEHNKLKQKLEGYINANGTRSNQVL